MDILIFNSTTVENGLRFYIGDCVDPGPRIDQDRVEEIWDEGKWKSVEDFLRAVTRSST